MKEFEDLVSSFYDLSTSDKKKVIHESINELMSRINTVIDNKDIYSGNISQYKNDDDMDISLVKIYHDLMLVSEGVSFLLEKQFILGGLYE